MSSSCPPQLHLELPPNTTSFKRSFDQFGFDLDSPLGASDATQGATGGNGNDRNKRARSASSFSDDHDSSTSSQSSTIASGSSSSSMGRNAADHDAQQSLQSALSATRPTPPFSIALTRAPLEPPRLPTPEIPEIQDIDMADYALVESDRHDSDELASPSAPSTSTHRPMTTSQADESYRLTLERFNAFDSQISVLRRSQSPSPPRAPASPPVLPPLELLDDRDNLALNTTSIPFLHPPTQPSPPLPEALYTFGGSRPAQSSGSSSSRQDNGSGTSSAQVEGSTTTNGAISVLESQENFAYLFETIAPTFPSTGEASQVWERSPHDETRYAITWDPWHPSDDENDRAEEDEEEEVRAQTAFVDRAGFQRSTSSVPVIGELRSPSPLFQDLDEFHAPRVPLNTNTDIATGAALTSTAPVRRTPVHAPPPTLPPIPSTTSSDEEDTWDYENPLDRLRIYPLTNPPIPPRVYTPPPPPSPPFQFAIRRTHARDTPMSSHERDASIFGSDSLMQWPETGTDVFLSTTLDGPDWLFDTPTVEPSSGNSSRRRNETSRPDTAPQRTESAGTRTSASSTANAQPTGARSSRIEAQALQGLGEALRGLGRALQESEITLRPLLDFGLESVEMPSPREGESSRGRTSAWRDAGSHDGTREALPRRLRLNSSLAGPPLESHMRPWLQERNRERSPATPPPARNDDPLTARDYAQMTRYMQTLRAQNTGASSDARQTRRAYSPMRGTAVPDSDPGSRAERDNFTARAQRTSDMLDSWLTEDAEQDMGRSSITRQASPMRREESSESNMPLLSWADNTTIEIRQSPTPEPEPGHAPTTVPANATTVADSDSNRISFQWPDEIRTFAPESMDTGLFGVRPIGADQRRSTSSASGMAFGSPSTLLRLRSRPHTSHSHSHLTNVTSHTHSHPNSLLPTHSHLHGHSHTPTTSTSNTSGSSLADTLRRSARLELQRQTLGLSESRTQTSPGEPPSSRNRTRAEARSAWQNYSRQNSELSERDDSTSVTRGTSSAIRSAWQPPPRLRYLDSVYRTGSTEHSPSSSSNLVDMAMDLDLQAPVSSGTSSHAGHPTLRLEDGVGQSRRGLPSAGIRSGSRLPSPTARNEWNWGRAGRHHADEVEHLPFATEDVETGGRRDIDVEDHNRREMEERRLERFLRAPSLPSPGLGNVFEFSLYDHDQQGRPRGSSPHENANPPRTQWSSLRRSPSPHTARRASPVRPPGTRVIHPDSFAPGPFRNTVQSIYESNIARENRIAAANQAHSQSRVQDEMRYNPPSIPPLAFDDDFTTLYEGQPSSNQEEVTGQQENRSRPQRPTGLNRLSSYDEEPSFFGRWMEHERSHRRSSSQGRQSTWSIRPSARPSDESIPTTHSSRRPGDIHDFLARRPRFDASRLENPTSTQVPRPRGDEDGLSHAIAVLRHDGLSNSRSSNLMNALRAERERDAEVPDARPRDIPPTSSSAQWGDIEQNTRHGLSWEVDPLRPRWTRPTPAPAPADPFAPRYVRASDTTATTNDANPGGSAVERSRIAAASMRARRARRRPLDEPGSMLFPGLLHEHFRLAGFGRRGRALGDYVRDEDFDESYESLLSLAASLGEAKPRATPDGVIAGLETGLYKDWKTPDSDVRCPICLDDYVPEDSLLKLSDCSHWLHRECLQQWLRGASTCPVCRKAVKGPRRASRHHHHHHSNEPGPSRRRGPDDGPGDSASRNDSSDRPGIGEWMAPPWRYGQR